MGSNYSKMLPYSSHIFEWQHLFFYPRFHSTRRNVCFEFCDSSRMGLSVYLFIISYDLYTVGFSLQVQFLIVFVHTAQIQFQPSCKYPKSIGSLLTLNAGIFTYLFSSFYIRSYRKKSASAIKRTEVNGNTIIDSCQALDHKKIN